jgi:cytochrome c oxidase cbb3-type subunit III
MKKLISLFMLITGFATAGYAQTTTEATASVWDDPMLTFYVAIGFIFIVVLLVLLVAVYMLQVINAMTRQAAQERAAKQGVVYKPEPSIFTKLWNQSNDFVPVEKEADIMLDHNYDGIRELDNHLPPWWKWLFYFTIGWSVVYLIFYHVTNTLPLSGQEYQNEVAYAQEQALKMKASSPVAAIDETSVKFVTDAQALADGKQTYMNNCASCHRQDGGGDIGPNLTDEYWLHGATINEVFKVVRNGVQGTNMIAWEGFISPEKMQNVSSYLLTLQGTNPANPKKPQGELVKPATTLPANADSVKVQASL